MNLKKQPEREGKPTPEPLDPVAQRDHIVRHLAHVLERNAGCLLAFVEQESGEGRLRAFDLLRDQRHFADVRVDEERSVREQRGHTVSSNKAPIIYPY